VFGWIKTVARQEKTKFRGRGRVGWAFTVAAAAYNYWLAESRPEEWLLIE
jgi:hypothetical protein